MAQEIQNAVEGGLVGKAHQGPGWYAIPHEVFMPRKGSSRHTQNS